MTKYQSTIASQFKIGLVLLLIAIVFLILTSCSEEAPPPTPPIALPELSTDNVTSIGESSAFFGGEIISDGGAQITDKGIVYSKSPSPNMTTGTSISLGAGQYSFFKLITDLTSNTKYYVRAYATNSVGTAYGDEETFTTKKKPAHFVVTSQTVTTTSYGNHVIIVTIKNDGETTGYNTKVVINALQGTTIVDTGTAFPANHGDILPGQSAADDAVFFNLTPQQAATLTFSTPVITWLSKD